MRAKQKIIFSISIAIILLVLSMFADFIPCKTAPNVPNPQYKWTSCNLNPDIHEGGIERLYFGYSNNVRDAYILLLLVTFLGSFLILSLIAKSKRD